MRKNKLVVSIAILSMSLFLFACEDSGLKADEPGNVIDPAGFIASTEPSAMPNTPDVTINPDTPSVEPVPTDVPDAPASSMEPSPAGEVTPATTPEPVVTPAPSGDTPYGIHGRLSVDGTLLKDQNGDPYQLVGISTHGLSWFPQYVNKAAFTDLRDDWNANVVRLAMYTAEYNGYCTGSEQNKTTLYNLVCNGIDYATDLGLYVIVDWHVLNDTSNTISGNGNPKIYQAESEDFFSRLSKKYKDYDNIIYEICNEPNSGVSWSTIKEYADSIIPIIRENDSNAVIIVGTPTWSQDVDTVADDPLTADNLLYALHFYADTHKQDLRNKMVKALDKGLPVFVSEYGICDASGNGANNYDEAETWVNLLDDYGVSFIMWNLANKDEASAMIKTTCAKTSGWAYEDLKESGQWIYDLMNGRRNGVTTPVTPKTPVATESPEPVKPIETKAPASQAPVSGSGKLEVKVEVGSLWENHGQYNISMTNVSGDLVEGWTIKITFSKAIESIEGWNGVFEYSGNVLTITPDADWNRSISAGASHNSTGFSVEITGDFKIDGVEVY